MLKERRLIAQSVADQLYAAEAAIDAAITATATLTGLMPAIRADAGLSALIGHDAIMQASVTCAELVQARGSIVATHKALSVAQREMGLGAVMFGSYAKPPSAEVDDTRRLRSVGPAAAVA